MHNSTVATQQAAYAACVSAQIARAALMEQSAGGTDAHNLAVGSITQANAVTRGEAAQIQISRSLHLEGNIGKSVDVPLELTNIGKTEALNVRMRLQIEFTPRGHEPLFRFSKGFDHEETGYIAPQEKGSAFLFHVKDENGRPYILTQSDYEKLQSFAEYISVFGRVTYEDIFGKSHWTNFCIHADLPNAPTEGHAKCAAYNQTDRITNPDQSSVPIPPPTVGEIVCKKPEK